MILGFLPLLLAHLNEDQRNYRLLQSLTLKGAGISMKIFASAYNVQTNTLFFFLTTEKLIGINCCKTSHRFTSYRKWPFFPHKYQYFAAYFSPAERKLNSSSFFLIFRSFYHLPLSLPGLQGLQTYDVLETLWFPKDVCFFLLSSEKLPWI